MLHLALALPDGQSVNCPSSVPCGGLNDKLLPIIHNALILMLVIATILVLLFIIWAGVQWTSSGGDKAKIAAARAKLTWAIIGLIIALSSFFIVTIFGYFFKVNLLAF